MKKTMRKILMIFLSGFFLLSLAAPGFSENQSGTVTLSPLLGLYQFDFRQKLDLRSYYGVRLGYNFTKIWGLEGMFGYVRTETDSMWVHNRDVHVFRYGIDALIHFNPDGKFVPFLQVGVGGYHFYSPKGIADRDRFLFDYGVGLKYYVSDIVALRCDVKQSVVFDGSAQYKKLRLNEEYTVGVTFLLNGKQKVCAEDKAVAKAAIPVVLIVLKDNHFEFDKSDITKQGEDILDYNIKILRANPKMRVRIAGYTSAMGTREYNQKLSERRAVSVKNYLMNGGVALYRLKTIGYGEKRPAEFEPLPDSIYSKEAKANMRVLFEVIVQ